MNIFKVAAALLLTVCVEAQTSIWTNSTIPRTPEVNDTKSVTLGLKFYSDVAGSVTAVRFYKGPRNTGAHVGSLWSNTGTKLAEVTFSGETASGWQQANFSSPISISANATYIISYLAPRGFFAHDQYFSWPTVNRSPLHVSGSLPGVFKYGSGVNFPNETWASSNYWVDLIFIPNSSPNTYSISGRVSGSAATLTVSGAASRLTTTDSAGNYIFSSLPNGLYVVAPSQPRYVFTPSTASVSINGASKAGVNFSAASAPHMVSLNWAASASPNIDGYNVYRATSSGGPYTKLNASPVTTTSYVDSNVSAGRTYFYVATALDNGIESTYSNQTSSVVPTP